MVCVTEKRHAGNGVTVITRYLRLIGTDVLCNRGHGHGHGDGDDGDDGDERYV